MNSSSSVMVFSNPYPLNHAHTNIQTLALLDKSEGSNGLLWRKRNVGSPLGELHWSSSCRGSRSQLPSSAFCGVKIGRERNQFVPLPYSPSRSRFAYVMKSHGTIIQKLSNTQNIKHLYKKLIKTILT